MADEKRFEQKVKRYLESRGVYALGTARDEMIAAPIGYWEKRHADAFTKSGLPDLHVTVHGLSIEIELKGPAGVPSDLQRQKIDQINDSGGCAFVLWPNQYDSFCEFVSRAEKRPNHVELFWAMRDCGLFKRWDLEESR